MKAKRRSVEQLNEALRSHPKTTTEGDNWKNYSLISCFQKKIRMNDMIPL